MRIESVLSLLMMATVVLLFGCNGAEAAYPALPGIPDFRVPAGRPAVKARNNGFLPAPTGVTAQIEAGRPYYVENGRRVYLEREKAGRGKNRR